MKSDEDSKGSVQLRGTAWVNEAQCRLIGERLRQRPMQQRELGMLSGGWPALPARRLIDLYFYLSALLFDFRGLDITLNGQELSGSDAFLALARRQVDRDAEYFTAARLADATADNLAQVFSVSGRPADCALRRLDERAEILRDAATRLLRDFGGEAANLLEQTGGRLRRPDGRGLMDMLEQYAGYTDPHFKKGFVLVKTLESLGVWRAEDRQNLFIPVDYHLMRVALRSGMVEVEPAVGDLLRRREPADDALDETIRGAVKLAFKRVEETSGVDIFELDELFWTLGRSCCHYARPPRCHACDFTHCTVMRSFDYRCPGECPLSGACRGSLDAAYAALFETQIVTVYY